MVTSGGERKYMYIDAEGKESLELKVTPLKGRKWVSRRERQWKVSGRRKRRRRGGVAEYTEIRKMERMECEISVG